VPSDWIDQAEKLLADPAIFNVALAVVQYLYNLLSSRGAA